MRNFTIIGLALLLAAGCAPGEEPAALGATGSAEATTEEHEPQHEKADAPASYVFDADSRLPVESEPVSSPEDAPAASTADGLGATTQALTTSPYPWKDGLYCNELDPYNSPCDGSSPSGYLRLIPFPPADGYDSYVGYGYRFDSYAKYRYLRREVAQLVRYAIHKVQARHPGTRALGLVDMSQYNGYTPGTDVGRLRHPSNTHRGNDIDIAYYTTLASTLGYNQARTICDRYGGSTYGGFCASSATYTHVVDIPRQTTFIAALFENPRTRVVGVDTVIRPLLRAEAERQYARGQISATVRGLFYSKLAAGSGWPYHQHHLHLSLYY